MEHPVVIVTGASRGVGAAAARWLGKARVCVLLTARSEKPLQELVEEIQRLGGKASAVAADVADPESCLAVVDAARDRFGRIDALVNNAGVIEPLSPVAETDISQWRYNLEVNVLGPLALIRWALKDLRKSRGRVVNVSSGAAKRPIEGAAAYCASKAALTHLTTVLAAEEPDVTSVCVRPGVVDTAMQKALRRDGPRAMPPEKADYFQELHRKNRLAPPEVPGRAVAWLSLHAPREWSGSFLDYDDPRIDPDWPEQPATSRLLTDGPVQ